MRLSALPPVRRAVPLRRGNPEARLQMQRFFGNRTITLYASGTAALAQAMAECAARSPASAPEVIIPAYGCPDLVAACVHASVYPRLVDVAPSQWSYDPDSLKSSLTPDTVAIVSVNLLGIGDCSAGLSALCADRRIPLIQDSAQYLPRGPEHWPGDYVILSFGRGKPMNLLRGGALVGAEGDPQRLPAHPIRRTGKDVLLDSPAAAIAFNILTRPHLYRMVSALPGTGLGEVTYKPLDEAALLPERAWSRIGPAFERYRRRRSYRREIWDKAIAEWSVMGITPLTCPGSPEQPEPLRLPLLAPDRAARDTIVDSLEREGLGASRFYGAALTEIAGLPAEVAPQGPFPHATDLAHRLFTLPTHTLVTARTVQCARELLSAWHRSPRPYSMSRTDGRTG